MESRIKDTIEYRDKASRILAHKTSRLETEARKRHEDHAKSKERNKEQRAATRKRNVAVKIRKEAEAREYDRLWIAERGGVRRPAGWPSGTWRAIKVGAFIGAPFETEDVFVRDGYVCQLCFENTDRLFGCLDDTYPNADHIHPLSRGGAHTFGNLQTTCRRCNARKGTKLMSELNFDPITGNVIWDSRQ